MEHGHYNPKAIGEKSEGQVLARLLSLGKTVLMPFGDNQRYDFVVDDGGKFVRVQCKTGRLRNGKITFPASSSAYHRGGKRTDYRGQIEFFGVFCWETNECYWVPVDIAPVSECSLRVDPPKNNEHGRVKWAKDFVLK
jgi:hypothetical protein